MKTDHLPTLTAVHAQPGHTASLSISTGRYVTVATADRALFAPELGVLSVHGKGYAVPAALFPSLRAALKLEGAGL